MKLALVITVKNERRLLRHNLLYHHKLGVDRAFIFLDGTTDGTEETIADLPYVIVSDSIGVDRYQNNAHLQDLVRNHAEHHTARQMLNMVYAKALANQAGYDWLIAIDADELLCVDQRTAYPDQLKDFFRTIPDPIEQVRFTTVEVLQHRFTYSNVFAEETLFKAPDAKLRRTIYDPYHQKTFTIQGYYGQTKGKSTIRASIPALPKTPHKFVQVDGTNFNTSRKGYLLHYYAYDFEDFIKKFKNFFRRPNYYLVGSQVEPIKQLWRDMVNDSAMTEEQLMHYYQRWVLFGQKEIKRLKQEKILGIIPKAPGVITIPSVKDFFNEL